MCDYLFECSQYLLFNVYFVFVCHFNLFIIFSDHFSLLPFIITTIIYLSLIIYLYF